MSGLLTHLIWVYPSGPDIQGLWCKSAEHWRLLELEGTDLFVWFVQSPRRKWKFFISACLLVCLSKGVFKSTRRQASLIVTGWSSRGGRREVAGWGGRWDTQTPASSGCTLIWKVRIIPPCMNYRFFFFFFIYSSILTEVSVVYGSSSAAWNRSPICFCLILLLTLLYFSPFASFQLSTSDWMPVLMTCCLLDS